MEQPGTQADVASSANPMRLGLIGLGLGLVHVTLDEVVIEDSPDWRGLAIACLALVATFAILFGWVVPRLIRRTGTSSALARPALAGVGLTLVAMVPVVLWLGIAYVVLAATFVLGLASIERTDADSRVRQQAVATLVGVVLATMLLGASVIEWLD